MKEPTRLIHTRVDRGIGKTVNPPIERGSTLLLPTRKTLYDAKPGYGRMGLTVHRELEQALCALENAKQCRLTMNGLQACTLAVGALVKAGDHVLITDSLYGPTSRFCTRRLAAMGVTVTRFNPLQADRLDSLVQDNTTTIVLESPGSLTFDLLDMDTVITTAKAHGLITLFDNTWAAGVTYKPLDHGVDVVMHALTKYPVGHADALGGAVLTRSDSLARRIAECSEDWGIALGPDDAYLALRGLRTLPTRLKQHEASGYTVARWLEHQAPVHHVLHPGLPSHPEHAIWQRDFTGACGLFGLVLNATPPEKLDAFLEALELFGMGFSWGGYESLIIPCDDQLERLDGDRIHARPGPLLRLHIGLEDPDDLIADLANAFTHLA